MIIETEELLEAWRAIFRTHDGQMAILYLRAVALELPPINAEACAVREHVGRRRFASELLTLAMSANDVRSDRTGPDHADDARSDFAVARGRAARVGPGRPRGSGSRTGGGSLSNLDD